MQRIFSRPRYRSQFTHRQWQIALTIGLLAALVSLVLQPVIAQASIGMAIGFVCLTLLVGWTQWRLTKTQIRLKKIEIQLHRLSTQQLQSKATTQPISHLDAEHFFSPNQTRH